MVSDKGKNEIIPFRESKLTRLLQDSLDGRSLSLVFININAD